MQAEAHCSMVNISDWRRLVTACLQCAKKLGWGTKQLQSWFVHSAFKASACSMHSHTYLCYFPVFSAFLFLMLLASVKVSAVQVQVCSMLALSSFLASLTLKV